ncbi:metallophosphoesterase [Alteromonas flava]|uniref:metallophosphoesterase n=1 Tax=Alteromonas flava TaxID=2048003 RepID=UPI000C282FA5|nr:metallophosphoesterase [Alteromonas flava]
MFDIIGDIHGHADKLVQLLRKLGYSKSGEVWSHPERTLISVGDLVDRGPQQREVTDILKPMALSGNAIVLMGNHEFNAVSWALEDNEGNYLRPHTEKNYHQHRQFLEQADPESAWYNETIDWFKTLPLMFEHEAFCCIHAAWDKKNIGYLKTNLSNELTLHPHQWQQANDTSHELYEAIEYCLKGPEIPLPDGHTFKDTAHVTRNKMRLAWWQVDENATYQSTAVSVPEPHLLPEIPLPTSVLECSPPEKPVFFGHYWMRGTPKLLSPSVACLDWSVVKADGHMVGYRFDGEATLEPSKLVWA